MIFRSEKSSARHWVLMLKTTKDGSFKHVLPSLRQCLASWKETTDFPNPGKLGKIVSMKFVTTLERDEDGVWVAECPSIPGCVSQGDTRDEALTNIREAIAACLEVRAERGLPLTVETQQVEVTV